MKIVIEQKQKDGSWKAVEARNEYGKKVPIEHIKKVKDKYEWPKLKDLKNDRLS